jgi:hypothetical protein
MPKFSTGQNPPFGFEPTRTTIIATPRIAAAKGDILQFDIGQSDGDVTNFQVGSPNGAFANLIAPTAAGVKSGVFALALEDVAADKQGNFLLSGVVEGKVIRASGSVAAGDPLVAVAASPNADGVLAAGEKYVALALEAKTTPTSAVACWMWFDGLDGFGTFVS